MAKLFGFLGNLRTISVSENMTNCKLLIENYSADINDDLINETIHLSKYFIELMFIQLLKLYTRYICL